MPGAIDGPLGPLPNMFWDPVRAKYFPNPRQSTAVPNQPRQEQPSKRPPSPSRKVDTGKKLTKLDTSGRDRQPVQGSSMAKGPRQRFNAFRRLGGIGRVTLGSPLVASHYEDRMRGIDQDRWTNLRLQGVDDIAIPHSRVINIFAENENQGYQQVSMYDNGMGMARCADGDLVFLEPEDIAPWVNPRIEDAARFPRGFLLQYEEDYDLHEHMYFNLGAIDGLTAPIQPENFIHANFGKSIALAYGRAVVRYDFNTEAPSQDYLLAPVGSSDLLTLDHSCINIVYAGLRNSGVMSGDFRNSSKRLTTIASLKHKAVVKVKRLCDSAVPFGLLVSGMGDKLVIFDIRFSKHPLRELAGHVNPFHSDLGLDTTPNGRYLFAGQSDKRVRAWSLFDGQRLLPDDPEPISEESEDLLSRVFSDRPTAISAGEEVLSVGVKREVYHFGPGGSLGSIIPSVPGSLTAVSRN